MKFRVCMVVPLLGGLVLLPSAESRAESPGISVEMAPISFASPGASYPDRSTIDEALALFVRSCAPLTTEYWVDVVSATASVYSETYDKARLERYGWRREIEVAILIKDHPAVIPRRFDVASQTIHFVLGGGTSPGILGSKNGQALCEMGAARGAEGFKSVPALAVIDR
jgi:hypothetical protein